LILNLIFPSLIFFGVLPVFINTCGCEGQSDDGNGMSHASQTTEDNAGSAIKQIGRESAACPWNRSGAH
jgi:hypothetical protein